MNELVKNIVNAVKRSQLNKNPHLIQISTDQIYSGKGPHKESKIKLINHYARTKYNGEKEALKIKSTILRTNFIGKK